MDEFDAFDWGGITYPQSYLRTLFSFAKQRDPRRILEIGLDQGGSALALLRGAPKATMLSVDISPCDVGRSRVEGSEVAGRFTFKEADSRVYLGESVSLEEVNGPFELIYIDGDHLYDAVALDVLNCSRLLAPGGVMVLDDADPDHSHFGVYRAATEFCEKGGFSLTQLHGSPSSMVVISRV